ncbi:hypothetical protein ACWC1D_35740 [Streptomyces sp. NPDC001478]
MAYAEWVRRYEETCRTGTLTDLYQDRRDSVWDNYADTATLRDSRVRTVDTESWGRGHRHHRR